MAISSGVHGEAASLCSGSDGDLSVIDRLIRDRFAGFFTAVLGLG